METKSGVGQGARNVFTYVLGEKPVLMGTWPSKDSLLAPGQKSLFSRLMAVATAVIGGKGSDAVVIVTKDDREYSDPDSTFEAAVFGPRNRLFVHAARGVANTDPLYVHLNGEELCEWAESVSRVTPDEAVNMLVAAIEVLVQTYAPPVLPSVPQQEPERCKTCPSDIKMRCTQVQAVLGIACS